MRARAATIAIGGVAMTAMTATFGCSSDAVHPGGVGGAISSGGTTGAAGRAGLGGSTGAGGASGLGGATGVGGAAGLGGATGVGGAAAGNGGHADGGPDIAQCQQASVTFVPRAPSVFILVDRSGSEFTSETTGPYFSTRSALLQAISDLHADQEMRIGFGAFVGSNTTGTCQPQLDSVPIAANNYAAIAAQYNALGPLLPYGLVKMSGPATAILPTVKVALQNDLGGGQKFLLLATDGGTDFCDDGNTLCPQDAVTSILQDMFAAGIGTVVFAPPSQSSSAISTAALQGFANAGAGQTVAVAPGLTSPADIHAQCSSTVAWNAQWTSADRSGNTAIASYGSPGGTAPVYASEPGSDLTAQAKAAIASLRSCAFDLGNAHTHIDRSHLDRAHVKIGGAEVPLDETNGWSLAASDAAILLNGTACSSWRTPDQTSIDFQIPCDLLLVD
jgi:hypothetical protein